MHAALSLGRMRVAWRRYFNSDSGNPATSCELEVKMTPFRFRDSRHARPDALADSDFPSRRCITPGPPSWRGPYCCYSLRQLQPFGPARGASQRLQVRRAAVRSRWRRRMLDWRREDITLSASLRSRLAGFMCAKGYYLLKAPTSHPEELSGLRQTIPSPGGIFTSNPAKSLSAMDLSTTKRHHMVLVATLPTQPGQLHFV